MQVKGNEEPSQVLLLSCKVKTECNSQVVFFLVSFKVKESVLQLILQCDRFTCINSIGVSQHPKHPAPPINSICQRLKIYTNIQCTVTRSHFRDNSSLLMKNTYFIILMSSCSLYLRASVATNAFASSTVENSTNTDPLNKWPHFDQHGL